MTQSNLLLFSPIIPVIWGYKASEVAIATKAEMAAVIMELQHNWTRRWEAIDTLRYIFSCADLSMELKEHGVRFLLSIMDGIDSHSFNDHVDYLIYMPTFYTSLQVADCHLLRSIFPDFSYSYYIMIHLPLSGY